MMKIVFMQTSPPHNAATENSAGFIMLPLASASSNRLSDMYDSVVLIDLAAGPAKRPATYPGRAATAENSH
jgi:hypothetical protein